MVPVEWAPGFFGKVTSHADFVARRVAPGLRSQWDQWLQQGIQHARLSLGANWLEVYLHSPVWRFVVAGGVCGQSAWAGVMMPSVDSVGRQFPLTLIARLPQDARLFGYLQNGQAWFDTLERLARSSLDADFSLTAFEQALLTVRPFVGSGRATLSASGHRLTIRGLAALPGIAPALALEWSELGLQRKSLWWTEGSQRVSPSILLFDGLPSAAGLCGMFDGDWQRAGL